MYQQHISDPELSLLNTNFDETYSDSFKNINKFLSEFVCKNNEFNLLSVKAGKWLVPEKEIVKLFILLENCRLSNTRIHYAEPQSKGEDTSALFIDFDIFHNEKDWSMKDDQYRSILSLINDILKEYFQLPNELTYHCLITTRKKAEFDTEKEKYRYGFHMVFSIKMRSVARRFIMSKLSKSKRGSLNYCNNNEKDVSDEDYSNSDEDYELSSDLKGIYNNLNDDDELDNNNKLNKEKNSNSKNNKLKNNNKIIEDYFDEGEEDINDFIKDIEDDLNIDFAEAVDMASAWVPVLTRGSCRTNKVPHNMHCIYQVEIKGKRARARPKISRTEISEFKSNICYEFSVNHSPKNGEVKKIEIFLKDDVFRILNPNTESNLVDDLEYMDNNQKVNLTCLNDVYARDIKELLDIIDVNKITGFQWMQILKAIMNVHASYKPLGEYFSRKSKYWNKKGFEKTWKGLMNSDKNNANIGIIKYLAKVSNEKEYKKYFSYSIYKLTKDKVFKHNGKLNDYDSACILKKIFSQLYKTSVDMALPQEKRKKILCQFITPDSDKRDGEVWKWRIGAQDAPISVFIYDKLENTFDDIKLYLKKLLDSKDDAENKKRIVQTIKNLNTSCSKYGNSGNANNIIKVLYNLLYKEAFIEEMDKDKYLIGVGNGVLELGSLRKPKINLVDHYHNYKISMYTPIKYKMFPDNDPKVKELEAGISDIIIESDAKEFILCMMGSCLNGDYKDLCYLFLAGEGKNGKSTLLELFTNTLGSMYAKKYRNTLLTGKAGSADGANSALMLIMKARAAYCSESNEGDRVNISTMKEMLSHEKVSGRGLFKDEINFKLFAHHFMTLNHPLVINTTDHGTWRRIKYYKCKTTFCVRPDPDNEYEKQENTAFAREYPDDPEYLSAFLWILIKYYIIFQEKYNASLLNIPHKTILEETQYYRNTQDTINKFITKNIVLTGDETNIITAEMLSAEYSEWYSKYYSSKPPSINSLNNKFYNSMLCKFFVTVPNREERVLRGMRILKFNEDKEDHEKFFYTTSSKPGRKSNAEKKENNKMKKTISNNIDTMMNKSNKLTNNKLNNNELSNSKSNNVNSTVLGNDTDDYDDIMEMMENNSNKSFACSSNFKMNK